MTNRSPLPLLSRVAAVATLAFPFAVSAQTAPPVSAPDEVVVLSPFTVSSSAGGRYQATEATSGSRISVSLFDSTQSVSVVTRDLMDDIAPGRIIDAAKYVASVIESTIPNAQDRVIVRGFQSDGATVDGFNYFSFANLDPVIVDRLEVVKGPNAILAPQGIPGGTINNVSKKPFFTDKGYVSAQAGLFNSSRVEVDVNRVVQPGKLAVRVVGAVQQADEYADGAFHHSVIIMPMATYRFTPASQLTVQFQASNWWATDYFGLPLDPYVGTNDPARTIRGVADDANFFGDDIVRHQSSQQLRLFFTTSFTDALSMRIAANGILSDAKSMQLNIAPTGANPGRRDVATGLWVIDPTVAVSRLYARGGGYNRQDRVYGDFQTDFAYKVETPQYKSTTVAGYWLNYAQTNDELNVNFTKNPSPFDIDHFVDAPRVFTNAGSIDTRYSKNNQLYLSESVTFLSDRATLSGGVSRNYFDQTRNNYLNHTTSVNQPDATLLSFGALAKPVSNVSLFYGYSEQSTAAGPPVTIALTSSKQHEVGMRVQLLEKRLYATLTYFDIAQNNYAIPNPGNLTVPAPVPQLPPLYSDRTVKGWEMEFNAALSDNLSLVGNFTTFKSRDPNDVRTRGVAEQSGAIWGNYAFKTGALSGLSLGLGADYLGKRPGDAASGFTNATSGVPNQPTFYLPARTLVNANVTYRFTKNWRATLNIENLLSEEYLMASISRNVIWPGTPTNLRLTARYDF